MKKLLVSTIACLVLSFGVANAQDVDTRGLSEEQKAQLALQAAQMKKQNDNPVNSLSENLNPEKLNQWVDLGKNIGMAVAATAKELGVASDEFLKSNTGKITVALIVWHVMGKDIVGVIGGTIAWIVLATIILWSFHYFHMTKKVVTKLENKEVDVKYVPRYTFSGDEAKVGSVWAHSLAFIVVTLACSLVIFQ